MIARRRRRRRSLRLWRRIRIDAQRLCAVIDENKGDQEEDGHSWWCGSCPPSLLGRYRKILLLLLLLLLVGFIASLYPPTVLSLPHVYASVSLLMSSIRWWSFLALAPRRDVMRRRRRRRRR